MAGLGYSILSTLTLAFGESQGLKVLPVEELPIESNCFFVWLKNKSLSPIAQSYLDYVLPEGKQNLVRDMGLEQFSSDKNYLLT